MSELFHPTALVETDEIGTGTRVWAFAHVMSGARVGEHCNIGDHAFIESGSTIGDRVTIKNGCLVWHGVHIEDDVFVGPGVVFTNDLWPRAARDSGPEDWLETYVLRGASLGANATVLSGLVIGRHSFVGAGSVVTRSVADHAFVRGNPARQVGWICSCSAVLGDNLRCTECEIQYHQESTGLQEGAQ